MKYKVFEEKTDGSSYKSWDELFENMVNTEIEVLDTGRVRVKKSQVMNLKSKNAAGERDENLYLTVNTVIIRHPERGVFLLDTGMDTSYQTNQTGLVKGFLKKLFATGAQDRGQSLVEKLGEEIHKVQGIFYTHLHFDHIAGTIDLPETELYISGYGEKPDKYPLLYSNNYLAKVELMEQLSFTYKEGFSPFAGYIDLLGDHSILAIPTPGHTSGSVSYLTKSSNGLHLLVGDLCLETGMERNIGPGSYSRKRNLAEESMHKVKEFVKKYPEVQVIYSHSIIKK